MKENLEKEISTLQAEVDFLGKQEAQFSQNLSNVQIAIYKKVGAIEYLNGLLKKLSDESKSENKA